MKFFNLSMSTLILRFYLMMAIVIVAGYTGLWALAFLALPIFMTCMLGMGFGGRKSSRGVSHATPTSEPPVKEAHSQAQHAV